MAPDLRRLAGCHRVLLFILRPIVLFELIPARASLEEAFMELTRESVEYQAAGVTR